MASLIQSLAGALAPTTRFKGNLTDYREGRMELRSPISYCVNQTVRLAVRFGRIKETFRVHLTASRVLSDARTIQYEAAFREDPARQAPRLAELWRAMRKAGEPQVRVHSGPEMRLRPRLARVFRVRSQALANFRAITCDVSETGACVACDGPVEPGETIDLTLDVDMVNVPSLSCRAEVVWCRPKDGRRTWLAGLRFLDLSPRGLAVLRDYLKALGPRVEGPREES